MPYRFLLAFALSAGLSVEASAQFTTFIPPKQKLADSVKAVVAAQEQAAVDSIERVKLTDMKTWVDSAAGIAPSPTTAADSLAQRVSRDTAATAADSTRSALDTTPTLRKGARAPETASDLPLLALLGAIALAIGTVMLAGTQLGRDRA